MTFRDVVETALGNLWRTKLRSSLTIAGIVIAIAAFVGLLSFSAGNRKLIAEEFDNLGLLSVMYVYPPSEEGADTVLLNDSAIERMSRIPGVRLVYPLESVDVQVGFRDTTINVGARALPLSALQTKLFDQFKTGHRFETDSSAEALVTDEFLKDLGIENYDSILGDTLIVSVKRLSFDSGLYSAARAVSRSVGEQTRDAEFDTLVSPEFWMDLARTELENGVQSFVRGFMTSPMLLTDTLTIVGVVDGHRGRFALDPVVLPAKRLSALTTVGYSPDPTKLLATFQNGRMVIPGSTESSETYPRVTLDFAPEVSPASLRDSVEALGFSAFSFAEQFDQIRRAFLFFDLGLTFIGLIALLTASLGIINTMLMSIVERTREIGILKSLGAEERAIKLLFLGESATIGALGSMLGILLGWIGTRVVSLIARSIMQNYDMEPIELFSLPIWLILLSLGFGIVIAVVAGYYPASRAARVDPVEALRSE